jgi:hypothetical protein
VGAGWTELHACRLSIQRLLLGTSTVQTLLVDPYPDTARTASAAHASKASPRATVGGCRGGGCLTLTSTYLQVTVRARIACFCRLWKWFFKEMAGVTNLSSSPRRCKFFSTREVRCCLLRGWDGINGDQSSTTVLYCVCTGLEINRKSY